MVHLSYRQRPRVRCISSRPSSSRAVLAVLLACSALGCGGSSVTQVIAPKNSFPRIGSTRLGPGAADELAGVLREPWTGPLASAQTRLEWAQRALDHLDTSSFGVGAAGGARWLGSERVRSLAARRNSRTDENGNGTNLDEVAAAELELLAGFSGGRIPDGLELTFLPYRSVQAEFAPDAAARRGQFGRLRATADADPVMDLAELGHALHTRVRIAERLLSTGRGSQAGATPADGMRGLLFLEQVLAIEETVLGAMVFDGTSTGRLPSPREYDPQAGLRWLATRYDVGIGSEGVPENYRVADRAAELGGVAAMLRGSAELARIASAENPNERVRNLFRGAPFGQLPRQRPTDFSPSFRDTPNYNDDVRPILAGACIFCHEPPFPAGNYNLSTYAGALDGGRIVKGDHRASILWQRISAPPPLTMPPPGNDPLSAAQIKTIADWIDAGAPERAPDPPPSVATGLDLSIVLFRNLVAMHLRPDGGLIERHDGDGAGDWIDAAATGLALEALVRLAEAIPTDAANAQLREDVRSTIERASLFAVRQLVRPDGLVARGAEAIDSTTVRADARPADLAGQARMVAGLRAAGSWLGNAEVERAAGALEGAFLRVFRTGGDVLASALAGGDQPIVRQEIRYEPDALAPGLEVIRRLTLAGNDDAASIQESMLRVLSPLMVHAEWDGFGESLGDGNPDTNDNGVPEPGLSGRLPLLVGDIRIGPDAEPTDPEITWSRHILPLFRRTCTGCHVDGAALGGYRADSPSLARMPGDSAGNVMPLITPGDPQNSLLYRKLSDRRPPIGDQMPLQKPPLDAAGLDLVRRWIEAGARTR